MLAPPFLSIIRPPPVLCIDITPNALFASSSDLGGFVLPPQWRENGPWKLVSGKRHPQQERLLEDHGLWLQHLSHQPFRLWGAGGGCFLCSTQLTSSCVVTSVFTLSSGTPQPKYTCKEWDPNLPPLCLPNPEYLAPEYILSVSCDSASDMYSLGVVMHAVFNEGKPVFKVNKHDIFKSFSRQLDQVSRTDALLSCCAPLPQSVLQFESSCASERSWAPWAQPCWTRSRRRCGSTSKCCSASRPPSDRMLTRWPRFEEAVHGG